MSALSDTFEYLYLVYRRSYLIFFLKWFRLGPRAWGIPRNNGKLFQFQIINVRWWCTSLFKLTRRLTSLSWLFLWFCLKWKLHVNTTKTSIIYLEWGVLHPLTIIFSLVTNFRLFLINYLGLVISCSGKFSQT